MVVLDTVYVSLLEWDFKGSAPLRERLADLNPDAAATTIISYEESMRGWMAYIAREGDCRPAGRGLSAASQTSRQLSADSGFGFR